MTPSLSFVTPPAASAGIVASLSTEPARTRRHRCTVTLEGSLDNAGKVIALDQSGAPVESSRRLPPPSPTVISEIRFFRHSPAQLEALPTQQPMPPTATCLLTMRDGGISPTAEAVRRSIVRHWHGKSFARATP